MLYSIYSLKILLQIALACTLKKTNKKSIGWHLLLFLFFLTHIFCLLSKHTCTHIYTPLSLSLFLSIPVHFVRYESKNEIHRKEKFSRLAIFFIKKREADLLFEFTERDTSLMNGRTMMMHNWYRSLIMLQSFSRGTRYVGTTRKENTIANTAARVSPFPVIWGVTRRVSAIGILGLPATSCKRAGRSPAASAVPVTRNSLISFSTLGTTVAERRNAPSAAKHFFTVAACANTANAPPATFKPVESSVTVGRTRAEMSRNPKRSYFSFISL